MGFDTPSRAAEKLTWSLQLNNSSEHHVESCCKNLVLDFAHAVDARLHERFVSVFAPDGVFSRATGKFAGHAELRQFVEARRTDIVTRHLCSTIRIRVVDDVHAEGTTYALVFQSEGDEASSPLNAPLPRFVEYTDSFVLGESGWRIKTREARIVFNVTVPATVS